MKYRFALLNAMVGLALLGTIYDSRDHSRSQSPAQVYSTSNTSMEGSGHTFGVGVEYQISEHKMVKGRPYTVVVSPTEPGVEILSEIPFLRLHRPGTMFRLDSHEKIFEEAFRRIG